MKKAILVLALLVVIPMASALKFNLLWYELGINEEVLSQETQVIEETKAEVDNMDGLFPYISEANHDKYVTSLLKELDYRRIGIVDTDTGKAYTLFTNQEGYITGMKRGLITPESIFKGSRSKIEQAHKNKDYGLIRELTEIPFRVKMKMVIMRWF